MTCMFEDVSTRVPFSLPVRHRIVLDLFFLFCGVFYGKGAYPLPLTWWHIMYIALNPYPVGDCSP